MKKEQIAKRTKPEGYFAKRVEQYVRQFLKNGGRQHIDSYINTNHTSISVKFADVQLSLMALDAIRQHVSEVMGLKCRVVNSFMPTYDRRAGRKYHQWNLYVRIDREQFQDK